eukprot:11180884-Lingulodinium_polyedra.AAC.1
MHGSLAACSTPSTRRFSCSTRKTRAPNLTIKLRQLFPVAGGHLAVSLVPSASMLTSSCLSSQRTLNGRT